MACLSPASVKSSHKMATHMKVENGITIAEHDRKTAGKFNPKLSVFREFALATLHSFLEDHTTSQSADDSAEDKQRQFFACDLIAQTGIAGLQWKRRLGGGVHVTLVQQRDTEPLQGNVKVNGFDLRPLPLDPQKPAGTLLPAQGPSEVHLAVCDPQVMVHLEAFDFVYLDPHKNPAPYLSSLFRTVRNGGVVCVVVSDTMQFARSPATVRRLYGAQCVKTEYLKELATRIVLAAMAEEAGRCNKGLTVVYTVCVEDFLMIAVRVDRGSRQADHMLTTCLGHLTHCRICEERAFCPDSVAPVEDPYSVLSCDCNRDVPGKTAVILGPLWKGSLYDYPSLSHMATSGLTLDLSLPFFTLLQRAMEECLCDDPPPLTTLVKGLHSASQLPLSGNGERSSSSLSLSSMSSSSPQTPAGAGVKRKKKEKDDDGGDENKDDDDDDVEEERMRKKKDDNDGGDENTSSRSKSASCRGGGGGGDYDGNGSLQIVDATKSDSPTVLKKSSETENVEETSTSSRSNSNSGGGGGDNDNDASIYDNEDGDHKTRIAPSSEKSSTEAVGEKEERPRFSEPEEGEKSLPSKTNSTSVTNDDNQGNRRVKRSASEVKDCDHDLSPPGKRSKGKTRTDDSLRVKVVNSLSLKVVSGAAPSFYYSMHSKKMGTNHLPNYKRVVERLRSRGYRCSRTHFEKYAIRTNADLKTLRQLIGATDPTAANKYLFVKGCTHTEEKSV